MTSGIDMMKRHLGKATNIELTNEDGSIDTFELKPLPFEYYPEYLCVVDQIVKTSEKNKTDVKKTYSDLTDLLVVFVKNSAPKGTEIGDEEYDKLVREFVVRNFQTISNALMEVNNPTASDDTRINKKLEALEKAKEKAAKKE
ncbi:MAG: hypothetical protein WC444_05580 [Candidatus Paceibacterota bacterium]